MLPFAPRLAPQLLEAIARHYDEALPIAEICRRVGGEAARLGLFRPSYERVRFLVGELRYRQALRAQRPSTAEVLLDVWFRARPASALLDHAAGEVLPRLTRGP